MLNIALPKGRLGDKVYDLLEKLGYECPEIKEDNRKLIFENKEQNLRFMLVKPSDVGVVGKDILIESEPNVYELLDLGFGKCKFSIAAENGFVEDFDRPLVVATKFTNVAKKYFDSINRDVELIKLNGSIEIAPIIGLSDVIIDIVETGNTLKENNLSVVTDIVDISARVIANKSSYRFKNAEITEMIDKIKEAIK